VKGNKMDIKNQILKKSLELFNKYGSTKVTTNQIAKSIPISPGTLYYHYKNKEDIIRDIFVEMSNLYKEFYFSAVDYTKPKEILDKFINENFELYKKFSFFNYEISALIKNDPILKEMNLEFIENNKKQLYELFKLLQNEDIFLKDINEKTIKKIIELIYFNSAYNTLIDFDIPENLQKIREQKIIILYQTLDTKGKKLLETDKLFFDKN
jgi:hypothetical protein